MLDVRCRVLDGKKQGSISKGFKIGNLKTTERFVFFVSETNNDLPEARWLKKEASQATALNSAQTLVI